MLSNVVTHKNGLLAVASEAVKNVLDDIKTAHLFHLRYLFPFRLQPGNGLIKL